MFLFLLSIEKEQRNKLEEIYALYSKQMYSLAYSVLDNVHDAQDVVQNTIILLCRYLDRIQDPTKSEVKHLVMTIAKNNAIDIYRNNGKHKVIDMETIEEMTTGATTEEIALQIVHAKEIARYLGSVSPDLAETLLLRYYYDFDDNQIADILCTTPNNVRVRLCRARKNIRQYCIVHDLFPDDEASYE